jgi:DHA2 family lincomycin resistance protein-like MFS transporter
LLMGVLGPVVGKLFDRFGPRALTVFGATVLTLVMWRFSTVGPQTSVVMLVALHVILSIGLACLFTPCFTSGLNPLPPYLYSHGSATLTTLQQVAGAAGTALLIAIYSGRSASLATSGAPQLVALNGGISRAFFVAALLSIAAIVIACFMHNTKPEAGADGPHGSADSETVDSSEEVMR